MLYIPNSHPQRTAQTRIQKVPRIRQPNRLRKQLPQLLIYETPDAVELRAVEVGFAPAVALDERQRVRGAQVDERGEREERA